VDVLKMKTDDSTRLAIEQMKGIGDEPSDSVQFIKKRTQGHSKAVAHRNVQESAAINSEKPAFPQMKKICGMAASVLLRFSERKEVQYTCRQKLHETKGVIIKEVKS
jgi:hypothetical protein